MTCRRYGEDQGFQSAVWEGEYNGEHKRFIYYKVLLMPGMDMTGKTDSNYIYPVQPVYQSAGQNLVRWYLMDSLGANKERLAISAETHAGASYDYSPKPEISSIKIGTVILGATSFPNTFPYTTDPNFFDNPGSVNIRPEVWINANRATTIAGTDTKIGFNFWGDRTPIA